MKKQKILIILLISIISIIGVQRVNAVTLENNKNNNTVIITEEPNTTATLVDKKISSSVKCEDLISPELKKQIKRIMTYVRIIVPVLVIVLGMVDFIRAMLAGKEEEMKKAQSAFTTRLIIAFLIFLTPFLINAILDLANMAWKSGIFGNSQCGLNI